MSRVVGCTLILLFLQKTQRLELFGAFSVKVIDVVDILLVALLLYYVYMLVRGTVAVNIFIGLILVYLVWEFTKYLEMRILSAIFGKFMSVGVFALIVVFQKEIRLFLLMIGSAKFTSKRTFFNRFKFFKQRISFTINLDAILSACEKMKTTKTGALLVIERKNTLESVKNTGDQMYIEITEPIIESIFFKNSPLHDGAAIIRGNYIIATRVILPISNNKNIAPRYGLRHRAAVGITEKTDALALVVSEETGQLSYIKNGEFVSFEDINDLKKKIKSDLN